MSDSINFFAYDELMNEEYFKGQGLEYKTKISVTLSAWRICFNKIPDDESSPEGLGLCNIEPTPNNAEMMFGVLYEMDESFLPRLDELHNHPDEYTRKKMRFNRHDFILTDGFAYVAPLSKIKKGLKPSKATMKILRGTKKQLPMLYFSRLMTRHTVD